jgi:riboflavin kinase/FMN adenylyltransferase
MIVAQSIRDLPASVKPAVATIGVFDGVHRGHQALLRRVIERAKEHHATPVVVTFDRHPLELLAPGKEPALITTLRQRAEVLTSLGIGTLLILEFNDALRHLKADEFVRRVLVEALGVAHVVVGSNFRFGFEHAGTVETLRELGEKHGFGVDEFTLVAGDETISRDG